MNDENYGKWITLKEEMNACKGCSLSSDKRVLGHGDKSSRIMIVTERPEPEDFSGDGFSGEQGEILKKYLTLIDIPYTSVYKTSLINCISDKSVSKDCFSACLPCLRNQFKLIQPEIIVCVGKRVCSLMIEDDFNLSRRHGEIIGKGKTMFIGVVSPLSFKYNKNLPDETLGDFMKLYEFCKTYPKLV